MTVDQWHRAQELFEQALALDPEAQERFLDDQCHGDDELRTDVKSLLDHNNQAVTGFLCPPAPRAGKKSPVDEPDPLIGKRVGQFTIQRVVASGGMGTVYEARQERPNRTVALKIMKMWATSRAALKRFEFESQVLARLTHPNIAQVYEAGTHEGPSPNSGVPYFVMEFVSGARTIIEFAEEEQLDLAQRLELFCQVCDAVHHGHQRGIIHRDLKPANILVTDDPSQAEINKRRRRGFVKVIDFGIARATDSDVAVTTMRTDVGQLVGTLQYMSPEQCEADPLGLDTRSDVYSLGVVLFELLCGRLPYDVRDSAIHQAARTICEHPPERPADLNRKLKGSLEAILLKALEKDRNRRYESAAELGADLRRYLNREPITARRPTLWTKGVRWMTVHPVLSTAIICSLMAGMVFASTYASLWYLNRRPHRMELSEDGREARVLTRSGNEIRAWRADVDRQIVFAEMVQRPAEIGGGKLAILGYGVSEADSNAGNLCAYAERDAFQEVLWCHGVEPSEMPKDLIEASEPSRRAFAVKWAGIFDVFEEVPGKEIVVVFTHSYSRRSIRIYDLGGHNLYEVWHDGGVAVNGVWLSAERILVFHGDSSYASWDDRGYPGLNDPKPHVVFGLRPQFGLVDRAYFSELTIGPEGRPLWYKCLWPPDTMDTTDAVSVIPSRAPHDRTRTFEVALDVDLEKDARISWTVDATGTEVPKSRIEGDGYFFYKDKLPNPKQFKLADLPPVVAQSEARD